MKTILHLTPSVRLLGARRSLLQLVTNLDPVRHRPVVVCPFRTGGLPEALRERGVACHTVRLGQWRKVKFWPRIPFDLARLRRIAREEGAALVHCNEPHVVPYGLRVAEALHIPCVGHIRLDNVDRKLVEHYELSRLDRVVTVSDAVARQFDPIWPDRRVRVAVIANGVDHLALLAGAPDREEARRRLTLTEEDQLVAQVGLISPRKRCHIAIEAFARVARQMPRAKLLFVGSPGPSDHPYAKSLTAEIHRRGLVGRVLMIPFREEIAPILAALDLNLLVSSHEGFGRVIVEAAVFGVPTIATRVGGIPEIIRDGETGVLVPPDSPDALAEAMLALLRDAPRRRALGEAAQRDALARFTIAHHAAAMMDLFDAVIADRAAPLPRDPEHRC